MIWKDINGHKNYEVSDEGDIRNKKTKRILKPVELTTYKNKYDDGYKQYVVSLDKKTCIIARIVAEAFVINTYIDPDGVPFNPNEATVDHKDNHSDNNKASNLQWVSKRYNVQKDTAKKVRDIDYDVIYPSAREAATKLNLDLGNLCSVCRGRYKYMKDQNGVERHFEYIS